VELAEVQEALSGIGGAVREVAPGQWQLEGEDWRLLVLTNGERDWLRVLVPVMSAEEALPLAAQLLEANFDRTRETRFALQEGVLWGVYQHRLSTSSAFDFRQAIDQLLALRSRGFQDAFEQFAEGRLRQIVLALKQQGKSLEDALQLLERLYEEGVLGSLQASRADRDATLDIWRRKLTRLWQEPAASEN
jgi:hypothetical protein